MAVGRQKAPGGRGRGGATTVFPDGGTTEHGGATFDTENGALTALTLPCPKEGGMDRQPTGPGTPACALCEGAGPSQ